MSTPMSYSRRYVTKNGAKCSWCVPQRSGYVPSKRGHVRLPGRFRAQIDQRLDVLVHPVDSGTTLARSTKASESPTYGLYEDSTPRRNTRDPSITHNLQR